jgi:hypothetical protein
MTIKNSVELIDADNKIHVEDDKFVFRRTQDITSSFLDNLAEKRAASRHDKMGDLHHVASIPTVLVERWKMEGFDIFDKNNSLQDIVRKLQSEDMQNFMATERDV